jgi:hypothetical protein
MSCSRVISSFRVGFRLPLNWPVAESIAKPDFASYAFGRKYPDLIYKMRDPFNIYAILSRVNIYSNLILFIYFNYEIAHLGK